MKKIVIIGTESTGKSTLCQQLSAHYSTEWVPEYSREHLLKYGAAYNYGDLLTISKKQAELEDGYIRTHKDGPLFFDTNLYVMKVWAEFVYGRCHQWTLDHISTRRYDQYLLCHPDLPWQADELREYPDLESRLQLHHQYKDILVNEQVPWANITGTYSQRLKTAILAVDTLFAKDF